ncbi:MAG: hypothetical protein HPY44_22010 [Armatimonadetes bacterium]|nr:hypothetical protein [Armatimonadota bacterium]
MEATDFGRSFVTFVTHGRENNARIQVECVVSLTDLLAGEQEVFYLAASCKSEDTFAEANLFRSPNYDFCGVFNAAQYSIIRTHARSEDDQPEVGLVAGRFERVHMQITRLPAQALAEPAEVVQATLAGRAITATTVIADPAGRFRCELEYPVKTMNVNDLRNVFQVDTGPVAFPDFAMDAEFNVARFGLAYVAFNAPHFADFVILRPTEIGPAVFTPHFSQVVSMPAENRLFTFLAP